MAVRKSTKKAAGKKKTPSRKASPSKKTAPRKKTTATTRATPARKAPTRKKLAANAPEKRAAPAPSPEPAKQKPAGEFSAANVNLGHVFSLRPPVSKTFRQADFLTARRLLEDEAYASIEEAARAVAEKALSLTHDGPPKRGFKRRR